MPRTRSWQLPRHWGGLGLGFKEMNYKSILESLPANHRVALYHLANGNATPELLEALRSFSTDKFARGVTVRENTLETADAIRSSSHTFSFAECWEILRSQGKIPDQSRELRFSDKEKLLENHGFARLLSVLKACERASLMKTLLRDPDIVDRGFHEEASWAHRLRLLDAKLEVRLSIEDRIHVDTTGLVELAEKLSKMDKTDPFEADLNTVWISTRETGEWNNNIIYPGFDRRRASDWNTTSSRLLIANLSMLPTLQTFDQRIEERRRPSSSVVKFRDHAMESIGGVLRRTWRISKTLLKSGMTPGDMSHRLRGYTTDKSRVSLEDPEVRRHWEQFQELTHRISDPIRDEEYFELTPEARSKYPAGYQPFADLGGSS
jgi:hypothetical protein